MSKCLPPTSSPEGKDCSFKKQGSVNTYAPSLYVEVESFLLDSTTTTKHIHIRNDVPASPANQNGNTSTQK